jgi:hypothetical protein
MNSGKGTLRSVTDQVSFLTLSEFTGTLLGFDDYVSKYTYLSS